MALEINIKGEKGESAFDAVVKLGYTGSYQDYSEMLLKEAKEVFERNKSIHRIDINGEYNLENVDSNYIFLSSNVESTVLLASNNLYDISFVSSGSSGSSLVSKSKNMLNVSIASGNFRNTRLNDISLPSGTYTASINVFCNGTINVNPILYLYRAGLASIAVNLVNDGNNNFKGKITFTNTSTLVCRLELQHSLGTATNAYSCGISGQIVKGATSSNIVDSIADTISLLPNVEIVLSKGIYSYIVGLCKLVYYSDRIICIGDSLTASAGNTTLKPASDLNSDTSYPAQLSRLTSRNTVNLGVGGETSWKIAARMGALPLYVKPVVIPSNNTIPVKVILTGLEQNYWYNSNANIFSPNSLNYDIDLLGINPCSIGGIKGNLTRTLNNSQYDYYFQRKNTGVEVAINSDEELVTFASNEYQNDIKIIWLSQNDAIQSGGSYYMQPESFSRVKHIINIQKEGEKRYIVMNQSSGTDAANLTIDRLFLNEFGKNYICIRKQVSLYGIDIANKLGAGITPTNNDITAMSNGSVPESLRIDGVHGNYWYYRVVTQIVYKRGQELGYW